MPLWLLAGATLVFGLAALPALGTTSDHGTGVIAFEVARTSARAADIVSRWGASCWALLFALGGWVATRGKEAG